MCGRHGPRQSAGHDLVVPRTAAANTRRPTATARRPLTHTGAVERLTRAWATYPSGRWTVSRKCPAAAVERACRPALAPRGNRRTNHQVVEMRLRRTTNRRRGRTTRWAPRAASVPRPAGGGKSPAERPSGHGDSRNPLPRALATTTCPLRTACTSPGTPCSESPRSSSGSDSSSACGGGSRRPATGRPGSSRYTFVPRTVRSPPSTSV